ncbi:MAG: class I SAM-dependent methyltransferase [Pirellulales bacterium]
MTNAPPKQCDLCQGQQFQEISRRDRRGHELASVICTACGLVAHRDIPSEDELSRYYADEYRRDYHGESRPSARRVMRAWKNGERIHRLLRPHLQGHEQVFEIGAGLGCTVKVFQRQGFAASGIDVGQDFLGFSRDELRANVSLGSLFEQPADRKHDCILLVHVIEHFRSPRAALEKMHTLLRPDGLLYVECPNFVGPCATWPRMFHTAHIHNFSPATLALLAARCGFEVEHCLSSDNDPQIQFLFRRGKPQTGSIPADNYRRTLAAAQRFNAFTYHLRPAYLTARLKKVASYLAERIQAGRFVRRLLADCQTTPPDRTRRVGQAA